MSQFLTPLRLQPVGVTGWGPFKKPLWKVLSPFVYRSDHLRRVITVPVGFLTDLASVPRFLLLSWFIAGSAGTWASVVHDYLCEVPQEEVSQRDTDYVFWEAMGVDGFATPEPNWRRWIMWSGVRAWQTVKRLFV